MRMGQKDVSELSRKYHTVLDRSETARGATSNQGKEVRTLYSLLY